MSKALIQKLSVTLFAFFLCIGLVELGLKLISYPPELNKEYQRRDIGWMEKNVKLNSIGYRDSEYPEERVADTLRIYALGDSYTYGWLVDNPNDTYPKILEKTYADLGKKIEVINAGSPGYSLPEMINRFKNEGKYYHPDLVVIGINDDEANFSKTYQRPGDTNFHPFLKSSRLYNAFIGGYYRNLAEKINHEYVLKIYTDQNSKEWEKTSQELLTLKSEAEKINAQVALVLFPHIHPNRPNDSYDYKPYNEKYKEFAQRNNILLIDPLEDFLKFENKSELVINPYDPHPTPKMNKIVAENFIKQFDIDAFMKNQIPFVPEVRKISLNTNNLSIGNFKSIKKITSSTEGYPWVYFETKNGNDIQNFPLKDTKFRNSNIYLDNLQTAKTFTHSAMPGATILYHIYPKDPGKISIPKNIYGYDVISINHIFALEVTDNGSVRGDYISPSEIIKNKDGFNISFYNDTDFHIFRINLKVAVRQLDISSDGKIENLASSYIATTLQPEKDKSVILFFPHKVSSWAEFSGEDTKAYSYAFVDGRLEKIKDIKTEEGKITLVFDFSIEKGQTIEFPVMANYVISEEEELSVEYE